MHVAVAGTGAVHQGQVQATVAGTDQATFAQVVDGAAMLFLASRLFAGAGITVEAALMD